MAHHGGARVAPIVDVQAASEELRPRGEDSRYLQPQVLCELVRDESLNAPICFESCSN